MLAVYNKSFYYSRIVVTLLFIYVVSFKTTTAILAATGFKKEVTSTEKADNLDGKNIETDIKAEFAIITTTVISYKAVYIFIIHNTAYLVRYNPSYYSTITIPPPDFNLQTSIYSRSFGS